MRSIEHRAAVRELDCAEVDSAFELMRDMVNLFIVPLEQLQGLTEEGRLKRVSEQTLVQWLQARVDWSSRSNSFKRTLLAKAP